MNIKMSLKELFGINTEDDKDKGTTIFGSGFHLHFHISINPTFYEKEKKKEGT